MPRSRSCISCVRMKIKCDNRKPSCSKCTLKGTECRYPAKTGSSPTESRPSIHRQQTDSVADLLGLGNMATAADADAGYEPVFPSSNEAQGFDVNNYPWDYIDWASAALASQPWDSPQLGLQSFSPATIEGDAVWHSSSTFTSQKKTTNSFALHMLRSPGFTMPSISYREHTDAGAQRVSLLMLQTLKSYPQMMMRQKTPPPFIHPSLLLGDTNDDLEAWHNCMSLVHMANSKIQGSRKLFWRNVRAECERFCEQVWKISFLGCVATDSL